MNVATKRKRPKTIPPLLMAALTIVALSVSARPAVAAASPAAASSDDSYSGSDMWLHYVAVSNPGLLKQYQESVRAIVVDNADQHPSYRHTADLHMYPGSREHLVNSTLDAARDELVRGLSGLLGTDVPVTTGTSADVPAGSVVVGTPDSSPVVARYIPAADLAVVGDEGYLIRTVSQGADNFTVIASDTEIGALYGTYGFLRLIQTQRPITHLDIASSPKVKNRQLDNWETERLYAGNNATGTGGLNGENGSIFDFAATGASADKNLPVILDRYIVVARALASVGINGITINNVNANNVYLTPAYIEKEAALADAFRPYGIKLSVSINYTAPTDPRFAPDTLTNAQLDPYSADFRGWWTRRAQLLHDAIPDFAGFTVKANSEGQPGPEDFGYTHADGANGIGAAVAGLGMRVFWRTFVYNANVDPDRLKRAYLEFKPLDGTFADNVLLQTKNGPLDYQAREPINPMLGQMGHTSQALELEIDQEYTGQNTMLAYLGPMWEEVLKTDTYATDANGQVLPKRLVGNIVDGSAQGQSDTAMVGVGNLGNADNLTGNHFSQANLFAFGRLAWDWTLRSKDIADDWTRMTWSNDAHVVSTIVQMMMGSREAVASYQTPLGLNIQTRSSDHYGPNPAERLAYSHADSAGLGYDRSRTGSDFVDQYFPKLADRYNDIATTPENLLMWFHHVPWDYPMPDGNTFWDELVYRYQMGVQYVTWMREAWDSLQPFLDARRFAEVQAKLAKQEVDAANWRDTCVNFWKQFSNRPVPVDHGPLSAQIQVAGQWIGGFDLSAASYTVAVPAGASPEITAVRTADPAAHFQILSQADGLPGQAVVRVSKNDFFGPLVKNYVFNLVPE